jgi:hypothetical protein
VIGEVVVGEGFATLANSLTKRVAIRFPGCMVALANSMVGDHPARPVWYCQIIPAGGLGKARDLELRRLLSTIVNFIMTATRSRTFFMHRLERFHRILFVLLMRILTTDHGPLFRSDA